MLNAAHGKKFGQVDTSAADYEELGAVFYGISAIDIFTYNIKKHFQNATKFIDDCLQNGGEHILILHAILITLSLTHQCKTFFLTLSYIRISAALKLLSQFLAH